MAFKKAVGLNSSRQKDFQRKTEEDNKRGDIKPRVKLKEGVNILMAIPSFSELQPLPYRPVMTHFNPFHICLRKAPYEDADGQLQIDKRFGPCPRCQTAWDHEEAEGFKGVKIDDLTNAADKARLKELRSNRSSVQIAWQLVDMTPFFKVEKNRNVYKVTVDQDRMALMDQFAAVMVGKSEGKGLPADMLDAAKAGPSLTLLSKTNGLKLRDAYYDRYEALDQNDPLLDPEKNLFKVVLAPSGKNMATAKGEIVVYDWTATMTNEKEMLGFALSDALTAALDEKAFDIWDIKEEDDTVAGLARALKPAASKEDLMAFLAENQWSLGDLPESDEKEEEDDAPPPSMGRTQKSGLGSAVLAKYGEDDIPF